LYSFRYLNIFRLVTNLRQFVSTLFSESLGTPIHLIFNTDLLSKGVITKVIYEETGKVLSKKILKAGLNNTSNAGKNWRFPSYVVEYVDIQYYFNKFRKEIDYMKPYLCSQDDRMEEFVTEIGVIQANSLGCADKFKMDLFYLAPLYPAVFPDTIHRLIILDMDIIFRCDIKELYNEFDKMNERQLLASAAEWSVNYWRKGYTYRRLNPEGKQVGELGILQGLNTGITLMDIGKIWKDVEANMEMFNPFNVGRMANHFIFTGDYGDQEFYVLFSWFYTDRFYMLPCNFNYQVSQKIFSDLNQKIKEKVDKIKYLIQAADEYIEEDLTDLIFTVNSTAYMECYGPSKIEHFNGDNGINKKRKQLEELDKELALLLAEKDSTGNVMMKKTNILAEIQGESDRYFF